MTDEIVLAKAGAAATGCTRATAHAYQHGGSKAIPYDPPCSATGSEDAIRSHQTIAAFDARALDDGLERGWRLPAIWTV